MDIVTVRRLANEAGVEWHEGIGFEGDFCANLEILQRFASAVQAEPAGIPELGTERDLLTQLEQYRTTCAAQEQTINRLRDELRSLEAGG